MSERTSERPDERLERALRELLRDREPSVAPVGLRGRIEEIPDRELGLDRARRARLLAAWAAVAAVVVLAVVAVVALRLSTPLVGPASSPVPSRSFDPGLEGPGIVAAPETGAYWAFVLLAGGLLVLLAISTRGWKRSLPALVAALLFGWALLGSYYPIEVGTWFTGPRTGLRETQMPPGVSLTQYYIVAAPGDPFVLGLGLDAPEGPIPLRLDGVIGMPNGFLGPRWTAVWLDEARDGSGAAAGPGQPFSPVDIGAHPQAIWVVGRAGQCAVGPSFAQAGSEFQGSVSPSLRVSVSVLLWPREIDLTEPGILEPDVQPCSGARASPEASTAPSP